MNVLLIGQLLTLLVVANGAPIVAARLLGRTLEAPFDGGSAFADGRALFGSSKTLRGVAVSILATTVAAPLMGLNWKSGALVAISAMIGDLISSFIKRRMGVAPRDRAIGLDQIPESLLPLLAVALFLPLTLLDVIVTTVIFFIGELALSRRPIQIAYPQPAILNPYCSGLGLEVMQRDFWWAIESHRHHR